MNKKEARQKKHEKEKKIGKLNVLDSEIIGDVEKETLLGNLARVKQIPMIMWEGIPVMPTALKTLHFSFEKDEDWFENLFTKVANDEDCDLLGFTPTKKLEITDLENIGRGSIGIAAQIKKVEKAANNALLISVRGICRYENLGFLPAPDEYFNIAVRWFEDEPEQASQVSPHYFQYLKNVERISKIAGEQMKGFFHLSQTVEYHYLTAQHSSFIFLNMLENWFTFEEQLELFKLTSTSERLKRVNETLEKLLPYAEAREQKRRIGQSN